MPLRRRRHRPPLVAHRLLRALRPLPPPLLPPPQDRRSRLASHPLDQSLPEDTRSRVVRDGCRAEGQPGELVFCGCGGDDAGVKDQKDPRDRLHHGGWMGKIFCWFVVVVLVFFVPNGLVSFYETISKFGSGLFLLVQVVLLLDFVHGWNDNWVNRDEQFWYVALLLVSMVCYVATFSFSGILFHWFTPSGHDCGLNTFYIVLTLFLVFVFAVVALHPQVKGSLLPASVISLYCTYLCYSGLSSEPRNYECNGLHNHSKAVSTGNSLWACLLLSSPWFTLLFVPVPFDKVEDQEDRKKDEGKPVSYSYSFFHPIFSLASMYSAMLLTGWSTSVGESRKLIDVGWPSVWIRIVTQWGTAGLFIWSLVASYSVP